MLNHQKPQEAPKQQRRRLTPAEQISAAKASLARAQARQRSHDTRSKIVLGGTVLSWVREDPSAARALLQHINATPPRPQDIDALSPLRDELIQLTRSNDNGASGNGNV